MAAGSAVVSGEDKAQQVSPSLDHLHDAMSGPEPRVGELRPADVRKHALIHTHQICLLCAARSYLALIGCSRHTSLQFLKNNLSSRANRNACL